MAFKGLRFANMSTRNIFNAGPGMKVALFGVLLIPLMFAGFYLYAFFDPYATLDRVAVAVVNEDEGALIDNEERNVGQEVCDKLADYEGGLGWSFVSAAEAEQGMESGTYYMTATIPSNFSERVASVDTNDPQAATFLVTYDESANMLASQIGSTAWIKAKDVLNSAIIEEYWQTVLGRVADSAEDILTASDGAQELADGLSSAVEGNSTITQNLGTLASGSSQVGDGATKLSSGMAQLESGSAALTQGMGQLKGGSSDLESGLGALEAGSSNLSSGMSQLETGSADLTSGLGQLESGSAQVSDGLSKLNTQTATLADSVSELDEGAQSVASGVAKLKAGLENAEEGSAQMSTALKSAASGGQKLVEATQETASNIEAAQEALSGNTDDNSKAALQALEAARQYNEGAKEGAQSLATSLASLSSGAFDLDSGIQTMSTSASTLESGASQVSQGLAQLDSSVPAMTSAISSLSDGASSLSAGITSASDGASSLAAGISSASSGASALEAGIGSASQGASTLATGVNSAEEGANALASGITTAAQGASTLAANVPALTDGANQLEEGSGTLGTGLVTAQEGSQTLADSLQEGAESSALTQAEIDVKASVMNEPIDMEEAYYTEVPNYGTGFAPFFIPLGIWVGCLLAGFLFKPLNARIAMSGGNPLMVAFSGYLPLGAYAVLQAVIALLFVQFGLGATIHNVPLYYFVGILCSLVFMAIMQFLVAVFGFVGRFLAVFLLTLQLTSSAGTFPLELIPTVFNVLNPWMPMTYAVEGLRQAMTGVSAAVAGWDIAILLVFGLLAFIGTALYAYSKRTVKMTDLYPLLDL